MHALTLSDEQTLRMARHVRERIEQIEAERRLSGWIAERDRFEREWNDDFTARESENAVFARSNESLNLVGVGVDYLRSRLIEEIFGGKSWLSASFRQIDDASLARCVERHLRWKLGPDQVNFEGVAGEMVSQACKLGECVAKIFYKTEEEEYERIASILWDERENAPVLTADGEFIFEDREGPREEWHPGEMYSWREQIVSERVLRSAGARAVPLHYRAFYCPLEAPSLHESDFVAQLSMMRVSELSAHLEESEALEALRHGEEDPALRVVEAYFRFDARGDGKPCRVFLMMAYDHDLPLCWDYIANVTPNGRYPFEAVTVNKEAHRWHGKSWFKKYERFQHLIDKLANQVIYRNDLAANPVKFRRKEAVVQWQDDQPLEIGPDKVFDLNDGYSAEDALQTVAIPELDEQTKFLLELVISNWRLRAGMLMATQGSFGGLPTERTATGVLQVESAGNTVFKPTLLEVRRGLEMVLRQMVQYEYAFSDADEVFPYTDGEAKRFDVLRGGSVRGLGLEVDLVLSDSDKNLNTAKQAVEVFTKFLEVPDAFKPVAAPLFANVYKSLQIDRADDYFQRVVEMA